LDVIESTSRANSNSTSSFSGRSVHDAARGAAAQPHQHAELQQRDPQPPLRRRDSPTGTRLLALAAAAGGVMGSGFGVEGPWSVVEALGVLAAIITIHECGHFLAARLQGIHVTEFSIGFGPALFKRKVRARHGAAALPLQACSACRTPEPASHARPLRHAAGGALAQPIHAAAGCENSQFEGGSVEYCLRAVPLGGYVAFPDDNPESGFKADDPGGLNDEGGLISSPCMLHLDSSAPARNQRLSWAGITRSCAARVLPV
jgi:hypothetical protein